jgi:hypothetical protein
MKDPKQAFTVFKKNGEEVDEWWDLETTRIDPIHPLDDKWVIFGKMLINVDKKIIVKSPITWTPKVKIVCNDDATLIWIYNKGQSYFMRRIGDKYKTINCNINYLPLNNESWPTNFKWDKPNQIRFSYVTHITKQNKCMRCHTTHIKWKKGKEEYGGHIFFSYNEKMNKMIPATCIVAVDCSCSFLSGKMTSTKLKPTK